MWAVTRLDPGFFRATVRPSVRLLILDVAYTTQLIGTLDGVRRLYAPSCIAPRGAIYAARVALPHAILVSLSEQAGSGYELANRFDRSIGHFWTATHQQIYRTLRLMESNGWVHAKPVVQHGRPDKKVYSVSDNGRQELARWIAEPPSPTRPGRASALTDSSTRDIAVKLRGAVYGDRETLRSQVAALRAERVQALDTYRGIEKHSFPDPSALSGAALHQYVVLRGGIRAEESAIEWLGEVAQALEEK